MLIIPSVFMAVQTPSEFSRAHATFDIFCAISRPGKATALIKDLGSSEWLSIIFSLVQGMFRAGQPQHEYVYSASF